MKTRNTLQRELVLQAVRSMHNHPTAEEIYNRITREHPSVSRATVYRNLGVLADSGAVRRVSHLNAADRFDYQTHPHYHCHCTGCDRVFDVELPYIEGLLAQAGSPEGFAFESYELTFKGLCHQCKKNKASPA